MSLPALDSEGFDGAWESVRDSDSGPRRPERPYRVERLRFLHFLLRTRRVQADKIGVRKSDSVDFRIPRDVEALANWPGEGPHFSKRLTFIALFVMN